MPPMHHGGHGQGRHTSFAAASLYASTGNTTTSFPDCTVQPATAKRYHLLYLLAVRMVPVSYRTISVVPFDQWWSKGGGQPGVILYVGKPHCTRDLECRFSTWDRVQTNQFPLPLGRRRIICIAHSKLPQGGRLKWGASCRSFETTQ